MDEFSTPQRPARVRALANGGKPGFRFSSRKVVAPLRRSPVTSPHLLIWSWFAACAFLGFALYSLILLPFRMSFKTLEAIERNTANGIIGIVGFLSFLIGALIHMYLTLKRP